MSYQPKSNRKFYATALTAAVVASAVAPAAVSADHVFSDVEDGKYYSEAVQHLADNAILQGPGDGTFNPDGEIIRASAAEVLMKAKGIAPGGTEDFSDVDEDDWFYNAVRATSPAIFEGDKGEFSPHDKLTREQAAATIVRAYTLTGDADNDFPDVEEGSWAEEAIAIAAENGIVTGYGNGDFGPKDNVTRKDFAVMVYRAMQLDDDSSEEEEVSVESTTVVDATTLEITWSNDETTTVELDEALVNGENTVTFDVEGVEYTVTVDYDAVTPAVEVAEEAIAELPEVLTLEDAEAVEAVRELVEAVYELDEDAEIEGLETLVAAEEAIEVLEAEAAVIAEATQAVEVAEDSLLEADLADAQELVDELSDSDAKVLLNARLVNVQDQLDSLIEAVNDADGELETFRALDVKPFENVNEDYITEYVAAITEATSGEEGSDFTTVADIQQVIDGVNKAILDADLEGDLDAADDAVEDVEAFESYIDDGTFENNYGEEEFAGIVNSAQAAIDKLPADYKADEEDEKTEVEKLQNRLDESVEVVENYVNVVEPVLTASTQVELFNLLTADFENVNEDYISDYEAAVAGSVTVEDVQYAVDFVNAGYAIAEFTVDAETTQADIDALEALVPMTGEVDEDGNATATDAEQELLSIVDGYQADFDNLVEATGNLAEAVADAEEAQEAYLAAGGEEADDEYKAVETALETAEDADVDNIDDIVAATTALNAATTTLQTETQAKVDTAEAVAEAEAAQEAYLAADGDDEEAVYLALEAALEADPQVETDIEDATKALEDATAELVLVNDVNGAETVEELETALVNLDNDTYNNLSSVQRLEVAEWFWGIVVDEDTDFDASEDISLALDGEIADYEAKVTAVNDASTITSTDAALENLEIEEYEALSASQQLEVAENVLNNTPENGYTSISEIVANF